eukprot:tig00021326_g20275.t1
MLLVQAFQTSGSLARIHSEEARAPARAAKAALTAVRPRPARAAPTLVPPTARAERLRSRREIDSLNERLRGSNAGLERAAAELRALVTKAPIPVFAVDPELRVAEWNPACEQVFGVPRASILARPFLEALVPGPYRAAVGEAVRRAMEQQATQEFEVALLRGDAPRPEADPPPCPSPSPPGARDLLLVRHLLGPCLPFLRPQPPGPPDAAAAAAPGEGQLQEAPSPGARSPSPSASAPRGGGTPAPAGEQMMEVFVRAAARVDAAGRVTGAVLVCQDLTAQREVTRVQTRLAEAAAANTAKTFFLAALSHEMRTPLNGLLGMLQLAMEAGRAGARRSGRILDLSLIEAGKLVLKAEPFSLPALVRSAIALLASKAAEKRLSVAVALADGLPASFLGDPDRLKQVLVNLVSNGAPRPPRRPPPRSLRRGAAEPLDAPGPGPGGAGPGPLNLQPRAGPGRGRGRGGGEAGGAAGLSVRFEVVDQGVGPPRPPAPPPRAATHPGTSGRAALTRGPLRPALAGRPSQEDPGGTGLGLVICKNLQLVEVMGGRIGVASRVGAGSTFWSALPFQA